MSMTCINQKEFWDQWFRQAQRSQQVPSDHVQMSECHFFCDDHLLMHEFYPDRNDAATLAILIFFPSSSGRNHHLTFVQH